MQRTSCNSKPDEIIYVQGALTHGMQNHAMADQPDSYDSWSQGADEPTDTMTVRLSNPPSSLLPQKSSTNRPSWSDDGAVKSDAGTQDSESLTSPESGSISDSDDSVNAPAANSAVNAMTRPPQNHGAQTALVANPLQGYHAQASAPKFNYYKLTGPAMIVVSLAGIAWGISLILQGADVLPRDVDVTGKLNPSEKYFAAGGICTGVSTLLGVAGACVTKYC